MFGIFSHATAIKKAEWEKTKETRLRQCLDCEHFNANGSQCNICGCIVPLKTKVKTEKCPLGIWTEYSE